MIITWQYRIICGVIRTSQKHYHKPPMTAQNRQIRNTIIQKLISRETVKHDKRYWFHTGGLIKGGFPVIMEMRRHNHPYPSIRNNGMRNRGFDVWVMIAAKSKTSLKEAFSPVRRYLSPTRPFSIAPMWPWTTSSTWLNENPFSGPKYPGSRQLKRSASWNK